MKKFILVMFFWNMIIFSVIAQISDKFIYWLSPNALSLIDERMTYTFVPMMINFFVLFLMWKIRIRKSWFRIFFLVNVIFSVFFFYNQYGDMALGKFR